MALRAAKCHESPQVFGVGQACRRTSVRLRELLGRLKPAGKLKLAPRFATFNGGVAALPYPGPQNATSPSLPVRRGSGIGRGGLKSAGKLKLAPPVCRLNGPPSNSHNTSRSPPGPPSRIQIPPLHLALRRRPRTQTLYPRRRPTPSHLDRSRRPRLPRLRPRHPLHPLALCPSPRLRCTPHRPPEN